METSATIAGSPHLSSQLSGQIAVITGATSGIGEAIARDLGAAGVKLVLSGRRETQLRALAGTLDRATVQAGDLLDPTLPASLIQLAVSQFGGCDIVINNAGVIETGRIEDIDLDAMCQMVRINTEVAFRMIYTALKHFRQVGKGALVNTSSVLGTTTRPEAGAYAGTKYAIEGLCEALRKELAGTAISVSNVQPGLVATDLHRDMEVKPIERLGMATPLTPADVARCVRFMLEQPAHVRIPRLMILPGEHEI